MPIKFNPDGWRQLVKEVIDTEGVARMKRVADAANAADKLQDGYRVSTEGGDPLDKRDYRATVITATTAAIRLNSERNTLIHSFSRAGGDT